jgi:hypothetical protein
MAARPDSVNAAELLAILLLDLLPRRAEASATALTARSRIVIWTGGFVSSRAAFDEPPDELRGE